MNRSELAAMLQAKAIRTDAYDLSGDAKNEAYVLRQEPVGWLVFYSERGLERDVRSFANEADACADLLARLTSDPAIR
jgi:hypothetical protein